MTDTNFDPNAPQVPYGNVGPTPFEQQVQALGYGPMYEKLLGGPTLGVDYYPPQATGSNNEVQVYGDARQPLVVEHMDPGSIVEVFSRLPDHVASGDGSGAGV